MLSLFKLSMLQLFVIQIIFMVLPVEGFSEACDDPFRYNLFNSLEVIDRNKAYSAIASAACSMTYQEMKNSNAFQAGGSYGLFSADVGSSERSFNAWKSEHCQSHSNQQSLDTFRYLSQRVLSENVISSWRDCMLRRNGLVCFASPQASENDSVIVISWRYNSPNLPVVESSVIVNGKNQRSQELKNKLYIQNSVLYAGEDRIMVRRTDPSLPTQITLSVIHQNFERCSCEVFIPGNQSQIRERNNDRPSESRRERLEREIRELVERVKITEVGKHDGDCQKIINQINYYKEPEKLEFESPDVNPFISSDGHRQMTSTTNQITYRSDGSVHGSLGVFTESGRIELLKRAKRNLETLIQRGRASRCLN